MSYQAHDGLNWMAFAHVDKYSPDQAKWVQKKSGLVAPTGDVYRSLGLLPEDGIAEAKGNLLVNTGLTRVTNLIVGGGGAAFNNAQAITGVGSTSTAATTADVHLGGDGSTSTAYYQGADATFPTTSTGTITMQNTFSGSNANFAWNEWCWGVATGTLTPGGTFASVGTSPVMLNHKVPASSLGTKASGAVWVLTTTVTLS
jgi:hypothetical protein